MSRSNRPPCTPLRWPTPIRAPKSRRRRRDAARWGTIASRPTLTPPEALLRCAIRLTANARDIADHMAVSHPVPRARASAIAALAAVADEKGRTAALELGRRDADARVRDDCERWLTL
ncbi:MAG: hypothetical protein KAF42_12810 [Sphingopyxis terrae]|nr:hypothetical protein [Sphingopyxis terrae]